MHTECPQLVTGHDLWTDRLGVAALTRLAFDKGDLDSLWTRLAQGLSDNAAGAGIAMDLSVIAQLKGNRPLGLEIQHEAFKYQRLFRSPCATAKPRLRVLALAAETDIGGNTPLEFLLSDADVELIWLYVIPGHPIPAHIPDHDIAIVTVCADETTKDLLVELDQMTAQWARPVINLPSKIGELDRDRLFGHLADISGLEIPVTAKVSRHWLEELSARRHDLCDVLPDARFPIIARPVGSHAGLGLAKLETVADLRAYLRARPEGVFFVSRFVDYSGDDDLFRKYRIVIVDGKPYACHMAISEEWKIWYLNGDMILNAANREQEMHFMTAFDQEFSLRHRKALDDMIQRIGLDYYTIDCAETKDGKLLIFEADNTAIVHDMDPVHIFPYKGPQMRKIFDAFVAMLYRRASVRMRAA